MTELEISKALALAIGWDDLWVDKHGQLWVGLKSEELHEGIFNYRDWNVIGPLSERYNAFPVQFDSDKRWYSNTWVESRQELEEAWADTPQKAIALAVIGAKK